METKAVELTEEQVERLRAMRDRVYQQSLEPDSVTLYDLYQRMRLLLEELESEEKV